MAALSRSEYDTLKSRIKERREEAQGFDSEHWWFDGRGIVSKETRFEVAIPILEAAGYFIAATASPAQVAAQCKADLVVLNDIYFAGDTPSSILEPVLASLKARYPMTVDEAMMSMSIGLEIDP